MLVGGHAAAHGLSGLTESSDGVVTAVLQEFLVHQGTGWVHLCPVPTLLDPLYLERHLSFLTEHYSRSWEISSAHVPEAVYCNYYLPAAHELKTRYFECFALTSNQSVGFKLYATPWVRTDDAQPSEPNHLQVMSALRADGVPDALISLLILAGEADVRFLILDPDAAVVSGLPLFS